LAHNFEGILQNEFSLDWFGGVIVGDFPFFKEMYGADVQNSKTQFSLNLTATFKFEILEFFRYEFEFQFVPIIFDVGFDTYATSNFEDNCFWGYYTFHTLLVDTYVHQNTKSCGFNLKNVESLNEIESLNF
jgi:hypothetical protein